LFTVTALEAVNPPSVVVTVIVALPADTPVTTPPLLTVAMLVLPELQLTLLSDALLGDTVAVSEVVPPTFTEALVGATETPLTGTFVLLTVIALEAVNPPSVVVAVMVALPAATPVTTPLLFTVAMLVLPELQLTPGSVALLGDTVAVSDVVEPTFTEALVGATDTPVTDMLPVPPPVPLTSKCAQPTVAK
jgi:hypothetical protein